MRDPFSIQIHPTKRKLRLGISLVCQFGELGHGHRVVVHCISNERVRELVSDRDARLKSNCFNQQRKYHSSE